MIGTASQPTPLIIFKEVNDFWSSLQPRQRKSYDSLHHYNTGRLEVASPELAHPVNLLLYLSSVPSPPTQYDVVVADEWISFHKC
ncbi:hypothetical protein OIU76_004326 [Salix suchowensis]|nr:hypothetical protein OIU76_004326 [Salix suchowensis]